MKCPQRAASAVLAAVLAAASVFSAGCSAHRTITYTSEPAGAHVWRHEGPYSEEVGVTPAIKEAPWLWGEMARFPEKIVEGAVLMAKRGDADNKKNRWLLPITIPLAAIMTISILPIQFVMALIPSKYSAELDGQRKSARTYFSKVHFNFTKR